MRTYQRKGVWYIDYSFNGRRVRKSVGSSKKSADLVSKDIEVRIAKGMMGVVEPDTVVFDNLCNEYLRFSRANKAPGSYCRDGLNVKNLLRSFRGREIAGITAHDFERHKNARRQAVSPASVNREISCMKHMFNKAVQWGYLRENHLRSVAKFKEPPGRLRYLNDEEIERLLRCCAEHIRPIVVMALNTGMRRGEIFSLKWADVDMKNRTITLRHTKNNECRGIPINGILYDTLMCMEPGLWDQYVFLNKDGKPFRDIKTGFSAALRRAGIRDFRFHDLRHTFASRLVMAGVDIRTVQTLMGHKDIKMTMRYSHLSDAHLRDAVSRLENGTNLAQAAPQDSQNAANRLQ